MAGVRERLRSVLGEDRWDALAWLVRRIARSYILVIVLGIVVGLQVAPVASNAVREPVSGKVAVVPLQGSINGINAAGTAELLREARNDPQIEAVVLRVSSPGGSAAASETLYLEVKKTAEQMPVVTSVDAMAASGGYYALAPSDYVYVKPASLVGSVGVFLTAPTSIDPTDQIITSGPNKLNGADQREWYYKVDSLRRAFVSAVVNGRGDTLQLTAEEVAYAKLYTGGEAVQNGMADEIGNLDDAVAKAARLADLSKYGTESLTPTQTVTFITRSNYLAATVPEKQMQSPAYYVRSSEETAAPSFLMLPPSVIRAGLDDQPEVTPNGSVAR